MKSNPKTRNHKWLKNPNILFSTTLASLSRPQNPSSKPLLTKCTPKTLISQPHHFTPLIISLLPLLLRSHSHQFVCIAARLFGRLSLLSIEANESVASDDEVLKSLVLLLLRCDKDEVKMALCNALLDVCTTSFGRRRLVELSCLQYLMLGFLQVQESLASSICMNAVEKNGDPCLGVELHEDELSVLLLDLIVILTNVCNMEQLRKTPRTLLETLLTCLKDVWSKVREQLSASEVMKFTNRRCCYLSNLTSYNLAESMFRLSWYVPGPTCYIPLDIIMQHIFGPSQSGFINFMLEQWESSPFLVTEVSENLDLPHNIFDSFINSVICEGNMAISSILRDMVSCPPVALNEIDMMGFLSDLGTSLGCPVIYQQDIRVVRTNLLSKTEEHYFSECSSSDVKAVRCFSSDDFLKCEQAFREGYTLALRGMEFRVKGIANIAREIASLFGQPSVGANLYITPPNSQGLACHFDDHCVFVFQLHGTKEWTISPEPIVQLPRLYEQIEVSQDLMMNSKHILLKKHCVLYVPRGFAHEAHTNTSVGASGNDCDISAHLTLAIEVEPPFEWAGFAHVALHQWSSEMDFDKISPCFYGCLQAIIVSMLHVSIRLISFVEPVFRKACLVAASSLPPEIEAWLDKNQREVFNHLIKRIFVLASFTESLEFITLAIEKNEDPFHWLRWLGHLNGGKLFFLDNSNFTPDKILPFIYKHKNKAEAAFASVKSRFCSNVLYDDAKESYRDMHSLYKEARMQYMKGMLSLHGQL